MRFSENHHDHLAPEKTNPQKAVFPVIILFIQIHQRRPQKDVRSIQKINSMALDINLAFALIPLESHR